MIVSVCHSKLEIVMIQMNYESVLWKESHTEDDAFKVFTFAGANHVIIYKPSVNDDITLLEKFSKSMYWCLITE